MAVKETIQTKLIQLRRQSRETGQVRLSSTSLQMGIEAVTQFVLSVVLAGAIIWENRAPFAVSFVGSAGTGIRGGAALLGACFGYLTLLEFSTGLQYASASILTFALAFALFDTKSLRHPWFMPITTGLLNSFTGFIILSQTGWSPTDMIRFCLEFCLTVAACRGYQALHPTKKTTYADPNPASLVLFCTLALSLIPITLYKDISLGRSLGSVVLLCTGWLGGVSKGAITGLALGAAADLADSHAAFYTMSYGLCGLTAGLFRGGRRWLAIPAASLSCACGTIWAWNSGFPISILFESSLAALAVLCIPSSVLRRFGAWLTSDSDGFTDLHALHMARQQLNCAAQAFRSLANALRSGFRPPENDNDVATVFERTASRVCRTCLLRDDCWKTDYISTFNAMNDATPAMVQRGHAKPEDFPPHFSHRCLHFPAFLSTVNEEFSALFYRRQYDARIRESRSAVCRQYSQLSDLLDTAATEISREFAPDLIGSRRARDRVAELGLQVNLAVFRDDRGLLHLEAEGRDCAKLARSAQLEEFSALLGVPLRIQQEEGRTLSLVQQEPLMAVAGIAALKKSGEAVSGDAGTYFKRPDGKLFLLLCDGMGSGPDANRESSLAIRLLEEFLRAGVDTRHALATLSSALALRGEETGGFTTVDLLQLDLFNGESTLFKLGAAPTYVKQKGEIRRLSGDSLPAGLFDRTRAPFDQFAFTLAPGDWVVMVSDGICSSEEDQWLMDKLSRFDGASPKELARTLITDTPQNGADDRTALVIRIDHRT